MTLPGGIGRLPSDERGRLSRYLAACKKAGIKDKRPVDLGLFETFEIRVSGHPEPGGSKRAFMPKNRRTGRPLLSKRTGQPFINVTDDNPKAKEWKEAVGYAAEMAMRGRMLLGGPLAVEVIFFLRRPEDHYRANGQLKDDAPEYPTPKPDATKLWRSTEDALTKIVWRDDAQIVDQTVKKRYGPEGVSIRITRKDSE